VKNNNNLLEVPNINSKDAKLKKLIYDVNDSLFSQDNYSKEKFEHLCVCSGGTTSSCAKNGFTTLDLRKNYSKIHLDRESNLVTIGGGVIMGDLVNHLQKHNRSFPIGLSKLPGAGYILTGGVSPLSRTYGLAIDNIESIKGFLGNGTFISLKKNHITPEEQLIWEAIKGAAPFFSIITEIELKTIKSNPIKVIEGFVNLNELSEIIQLSEEFPENISLQWIYAQKIYIYVFAELKNNIKVIDSFISNDEKNLIILTSIGRIFKFNLSDKFFLNHSQETIDSGYFHLISLSDILLIDLCIGLIERFKIKDDIRKVYRIKLYYYKIQ